MMSFRYIGILLNKKGYFTLSDLTNKFGTSTLMAETEVKMYLENINNNIKYNENKRRYEVRGD